MWKGIEFKRANKIRQHEYMRFSRSFTSAAFHVATVNRDRVNFFAFCYNECAFSLHGKKLGLRRKTMYKKISSEFFVLNDQNSVEP